MENNTCLPCLVSAMSCFGMSCFGNENKTWKQALFRCLVLGSARTRHETSLVSKTSLVLSADETSHQNKPRLKTSLVLMKTSDLVQGLSEHNSSTLPEPTLRPECSHFESIRRSLVFMKTSDQNALTLSPFDRSLVFMKTSDPNALTLSPFDGRSFS